MNIINEVETLIEEYRDDPENINLHATARDIVAKVIGADKTCKELYEALKLIKRAWENGSTGYIPVVILEEIDKAIAKYEGRE